MVETGGRIVELSIILPIVKQIRGATFATLDAVTKPSPGIRKVATGVRVVLFNTRGESGYGAMVKRRLAEAGRNPDNFVVGDLPWGERIDGTCLIQHRGVSYLQSIVLDAGRTEYFIGNVPVSPEGLGLREGSQRTNQGLSPASEVLVATYRLDSITRIALMGEELT
jgi:hypothetical protein